MLIIVYHDHNDSEMEANLAHSASYLDLPGPFSTEQASKCIIEIDTSKDTV